MMNSMDHFKTIVAEERRRAGLTQEALAARIGITPQAISKWENGIGYPDVTLFPLIAKALGVSISRLFGEEEGGSTGAACKPNLPSTYQGMSFVGAYGHYVCYADKTLQSWDTAQGKAQFEDGSEADLNLGVSLNRGAGEMRVYEIEDILPETVREGEGKVNTSLERSFSYHPALILSVSYACDIHILTSTDVAEGMCRVSAMGHPNFIAAVTMTEAGERLQIEVKNQNSDRGGPDGNQLTIHMGVNHAGQLKCSLNASGKMEIAPDFDLMELSINGCFGIAANRTNEAVLKINGAGNIHMKEVLASVEMKINGSGDIDIQRCVSPKMKINGSGDIQCGEVCGVMSAEINGSGDITCDGDLSQLTLKINGCGDFHGEKLCVTDAEIHVPRGEADITIGQIRGTSMEKLCRKSTLKVGKRGI